MKKLKNLTLRQKKLLESQGLDPNNYLLERTTADDFIFYEKSTGKLIPIRR